MTVSQVGSSPLCSTLYLYMMKDTKQNNWLIMGIQDYITETKKKKVAQMINDGAVRKIKSIQLNMKMGKGIISFPII